MPTNLTTPITGPLSVTIDATVLQLAVKTTPGLSHAIFRLEGPNEVIRGVKPRTSHEGDLWHIAIPDPEPVVVHGRGPTVMAGNIHGNVGNVFFGGGTTVINGTIINGAGAGADPVKGQLLLPVGASLGLPRLHVGHVLATGSYGVVSFNGTNAGLNVDHAREVDAETTNGSITVGSASDLIIARTANGAITTRGSAPDTTARTANGSIMISASGSHKISARSANGNITVLRNGHTNAQIRTSTTNGHDQVL